MSILKFFGLLLCSCMLLSCNSGSTTTSTTQNTPLNPMIITLTDGTTITVPISNVYVPFGQSVQIPITIVGGSSAKGESVSISASIQASASNAVPDVVSTDVPTVTTSPSWINIVPNTTSTIYLNVDDIDDVIGTYSISLMLKDMSTDTVIIAPIHLPVRILEKTCTSSELQSCRKANCFAYMTPGAVSVNQANYLQYSAIAVMNLSNYDSCFANITQQTAWGSTATSIASIDTSGQAAGLNIGDTVISAGSNTYNINYLWSESSQLSVVPAVPYPGGYGGLSVTNVGDVTYSCTNGLNKNLYIMVNNGTGILGQVVHSWVWLTGYVIYAYKGDVSINVGDTGYGEALAFTAGHKFSANEKECKDNTPYYINFVYGGTVNGYTYPDSSYYVQIKVIP